MDIARERSREQQNNRHKSMMMKRMKKKICLIEWYSIAVCEEIAVQLFRLPSNVERSTFMRMLAGLETLSITIGLLCLCEEDGGNWELGSAATW